MKGDWLGGQSLKNAIRAIFFIALAAAVVGLIWCTHGGRRSVPGHIVRWFLGESGMEQDLNDTVDEVRALPSLSQLQPWGVETLRRYRDGELRTNGYASFYWDQPPAVKLAHEERPDFIKKQWGETDEFGQEEPEIFIVFNTNNVPEAVTVGWYSHGIRIGPPQYRMDYPSSDVSPYVEVRPGIFVYENYK